MRIVLALLSLLFFACQGLSQEPIVLDEELQIQPVETDVWLIIHRFPGACNSLIAQCSEKEFVWCDTPCTDAATRQAHEWLKTICPDPNIIQINTGFHNDNLAGNGYLIAQGIPCYGSDLTPKLIVERWPKTAQAVLPFYEQQTDPKYRDHLVSHKLVPPNRLYPLAEGKTLYIGNESVEIWFPGPTHAPDNVVVYFKSKRLLYGGCMIKAQSATSPGFIEDAVMDAWPSSVQKVLDRFPESRIVVPGHGRWGDIKLLKHTIELCELYTATSSH